MRTLTEIYGHRVLPQRADHKSIHQRSPLDGRGTIDRPAVRHSRIIIERHELIRLPGNRWRVHKARGSLGGRYYSKHVTVTGNHRHLFPAVQTANLALLAPAIEWHRLLIVVVGTENKAVGSGRTGDLPSRTCDKSDPAVATQKTATKSNTDFMDGDSPIRSVRRQPAIAGLPVRALNRMQPVLLPSEKTARRAPSTRNRKTGNSRRSVCCKISITLIMSTGGVLSVIACLRQLILFTAGLPVTRE